MELGSKVARRSYEKVPSTEPGGFESDDGLDDFCNEGFLEPGRVSSRPALPGLSTLLWLSIAAATLGTALIVFVLWSFGDSARTGASSHFASSTVAPILSNSTPIALVELKRTDPIVRAASQKWRGQISPDNTFISWKGIRYAQAPTGDGRFRLAQEVKLPYRPPRSENAWAKIQVQDADDYGPGCPRWKTKPTNESFWEGEEDCLKLHISAPALQTPDELLPVMFWIHGGGFQSGASHLTRYDTSSLMRRSIELDKPIIIVTINYRLGALGFSSNLREPEDDATAGVHRKPNLTASLDLNIGLKDQIAALEWVRSEIRNFGGDPEKIILAGHSAGAISVGLHQLYTQGDMFRGTFMLSGSPTSFPVPWPHEMAQRVLLPLQEPAGCVTKGSQGGVQFEADLLSCLRNLTIDELMHATLDLKRYKFPWYPVLEGDFEDSWLSTRPSVRQASGHFARVPFVIGTVLDEGTKFVDSDVDSPMRIESAFRRSFSFTYDDLQEEVMPRLFELYPADPSVGSPYRTGSETFGLSPSYKRAASLIGDVFFQAPKRHFLGEVRDRTEYEGSPSYPMWNYLFEKRPERADKATGVAHGTDLASWFGTPQPKDPQADELAKVLSAYLINFVTHLDPNDKGLPDWPKFASSGETMRFDNGRIAIGKDDDREEAIKLLIENDDLFAR